MILDKYRAKYFSLSRKGNARNKVKKIHHERLQKRGFHLDQEVEKDIRKVHTIIPQSSLDYLKNETKLMKVYEFIIPADAIAIKRFKIKLNTLCFVVYLNVHTRFDMVSYHIA